MEESELIGNMKYEDFGSYDKISNQDKSLFGMIENLNNKIIRQPG